MTPPPNNRTHGQTVDGKNGCPTPEYRAYQAAKSRCQNPNVRNYNRYGGRGILFKFTSFEQFYAHLGPRPSDKHSLDRINNQGHYEEGNVYWATSSQQAYNRSKVFRVTPRKDTTSGCPGVTRFDDRYWNARISVNGRSKSLGVYKNFEDAVAARRKALESIPSEAVIF